MKTRYFALVMGIIFAVVGVAGFVPGLLAPLEPVPLAVTALSGRLLGLFPVNVLHSLVHLLFGIWGIAAYRSIGSARGYAKAVTWIYGLLTIAGLVPGLNTTFGLVPIYGHDVWLHLAITAAAAYFAYGVREQEVASTQASTNYYR
ncbi:DUF4383 domain-containing protein [Arenibaculum pallidiluteum]|uniref:DUF4383 domain-containing protein n=1 Tax=Arenibaculum pallidiluteum TaxID=2812559 RepID=UPI002E2CEB26|nr:DUF4383 domain-containing protein [Arenibaculum pallidiluteum]